VKDEIYVEKNKPLRLAALFEGLPSRLRPMFSLETSGKFRIEAGLCVFDAASNSLRFLRSISPVRDYAFSQTALGKGGSPAANSADDGLRKV
jgi:hypothetical protein